MTQLYSQNNFEPIDSGFTELIPMPEFEDYSLGMNWLMTEQIARERQQALLEESHNRHLVELETPSFRIRVAHWLRTTADKLEPLCQDALQTVGSELASSK
jgi:hypothetical protein